MKKTINKNKIGTAIMSYSLFFIIFILIFNYFDIYSVSNNHIIYLQNFRDILIDFFKIGKFNLFSWDVFLGNDMFLNYLYLMLGDVFSYLCVLVPNSSISDLYIILIYFRLFLLGISFIIYSKSIKITNFSSIIGALIYVFSSYSLYLSISNPYILNMMILVPFLLIGIEKLIINNKKVLFIFLVAISLITNIYFMPFILLIVICYSSILIFNKYFIYGFRVIFSAYLRVFLSLVVSFLISSIVLIPFIFNSYNYILEVNNYFNISLLGLNGLFLVYLPLGFKKINENKNYIILFVLMSIFFLIFNICFSSHFNNNFGFIISFISSIIIARTIDLYFNISRVDFKWIISFIFLILLFIYVFNVEISKTLIFALITGVGFLIILLNKKEFMRKINLYGIIFYIFLLFSVCFSTMNFLSNYRIEEENYTNLEILKDEIKDDSFYRVVVDDSEYIEKDSYNYLDNKYYQLDLDLNILSLNDFNNRTRILSLIGEKYYISNNSDLYVPKKHKLLFEKDGYSVFENKYYVGFGVFYDSYVPSNIYNEFNSLEKESSLLKSVVIDDKDIDSNYLKQNNLIRDEVSRDVVKVSSKVRKEKNKLYVSVDNNDNEGELYLEISNFKSDGGIISFGFRDRIYNKEVSECENLLINFTSFGSFDDEIVIDLGDIYNYSYDSMSTYIVDFDSYINDIEKIKSSNFEVLEYNDSYIKAKVDSSSKGIMQFSTSYSKNWDVLIDGKKVDTYVVNNCFLGVYLDEGIHEIELVYNFEYSILSFVLFGVGLVLFCGIIIIETRKDGVNHEKRKKRS